VGGVKTRIQDQIKDIAISIPSVIQGRQLRTHVGEGTVRIVIPILVGQQNPAQLSLLYRTPVVSRETLCIGRSGKRRRT
jgi:hypothetical protein